MQLQEALNLSLQPTCLSTQLSAVVIKSYVRRVLESFQFALSREIINQILTDGVCILDPVT